MDVRADFDAISGCVCVVGSMNADYTVAVDNLPQPGETVFGGAMRVLPGGKSGNQAAAAALLGCQVKMFGAVGDDSNAEFLLGKLRQAGADVSHVLRAPGPSGTTLITVDARGENTIVYSAGSNALVTPEYLQGCAQDVTSGTVLGLCLESPMETVVAAAQLCHAAGMKVLLNNSPFTTQLPRPLIDACDILLVNQVEAMQLLNLDTPAHGTWDDLDWAAVAAKMRDYGFSSAVITLGGEGSVAIDAGKTTRIDAVKVKAVDTTGCGDAFMGTVLAGLASGFSLSRAARLASCVSAYAALSEGAQASYGTAAQVKARFA